MMEWDSVEGESSKISLKYNVMCNLDGRGVWGRMDTSICMAESICYSPETITTLLIGYIPIQNKKLKNE